MLGRRFECDICGKTFTHSRVLNKHMQKSHYYNIEEGDQNVEHKCETCNKIFTNVGDLLVHVQSKHFTQSMNIIDHDDQLEHSRPENLKKSRQKINFTKKKFQYFP